MRITLGIDPGLTGAVAALDVDGNFLWVRDTPTAKVTKTKSEYLESAMAQMLGACEDTIDHVWIETQQSMPKQGVASTFKTGVGYGIWLGIIAAYGLPHTAVRATEWKKELGIPPKSDKDVSRAYAQRLHPSSADQLERKLDHGRADAICIAEYGRRYMGWGT
jgi:crossover junction endodeoxyribonuclease RuvC